MARYRVFYQQIFNGKVLNDYVGRSFETREEAEQSINALRQDPCVVYAQIEKD